MLHAGFIAVHAAGGTLAFCLGVLILAQPPQARSAVAGPYVAALATMIIFLVLALAVDWGSLAAGLRGVFAALVVLAFYTGWRGWQAYGRISRAAGHGSPAMVDDVGFTLITLFVGFVVITANDLGAPAWAVVALAVLGIVVGRRAVERVKAREAAAP